MKGVWRPSFQFTPKSFFKLSFLLLFWCVTFWNDEAEAYMVGTNPYRRVEMLDPRGKYWLEWEVNWDAKKITFSVTVETKGYVGFGLSDNGKMSGADIVIGGVLANGQTYFSDRHAVGNLVPEEDQSQDWHLLSAKENKTHTFLSFSRLIDTCDPEDYLIRSDKVSLIWAYGETDDELEYHFRNRGEFPVHLLDPDYSPPIKRDPETGNPLDFHSPYGEQVKVFSWKLVYDMSADDTTYWCTIHKGPVLLRKHHYIGFDMRFTDDHSRKHHHHVLVNKCQAPQGFNDREMFDRYLGQGQTCFGSRVQSQFSQQFTGPIPLEYCTDFLTGTSFGDRITFNPPHVGNPLGESRDEYYMIQIHYDNPEMRVGIRVEVNLDVFYTPQLRKNEGDLLMFRHESPGFPPSYLIPPSSINHKNHAVCSSQCTQKMFPPEGIRIHTVLLHSHNSGKQIRLRHFRGNLELPFIAVDDNYSFSYQQFRNLRKEVQVFPGDQLMVECVTDTTWTNGTAVGGFTTRQEMCAAWLMYYEKLQKYMTCSSEIISPEKMEYFLGIQNVSWSNQFVECLASTPRHLAGLTVTQVSDKIDWTLSKREELQRFQLQHSQLNRCPMALYARKHGKNPNGEPMDLQPEESLGNLASIPTPSNPYERPGSTCRMRGSNEQKGAAKNRHSTAKFWY